MAKLIRGPVHTQVTPTTEIQRLFEDEPHQYACTLPCLTTQGTPASGANRSVSQTTASSQPNKSTKPRAKRRPGNAPLPSHSMQKRRPFHTKTRATQHKAQRSGWPMCKKGRGYQLMANIFINTRILGASRSPWAEHMCKKGRGII